MENFERVPLKRIGQLSRYQKNILWAIGIDYADTLYVCLRRKPEDMMDTLVLDEDGYMKVLAACEKFLPEEYAQLHEKKLRLPRGAMKRALEIEYSV